MQLGQAAIEYLLLNRAYCSSLSFAYLLPTPFSRFDRRVNMLLDISPGNTGLRAAIAATAVNAKSSIHVSQRWVVDTPGGQEAPPEL